MKFVILFLILIIVVAIFKKPKSHTEHFTDALQDSSDNAKHTQSFISSFKRMIQKIPKLFTSSESVLEGFATNDFLTQPGPDDYFNKTRTEFNKTQDGQELQKIIKSIASGGDDAGKTIDGLNMIAKHNLDVTARSRTWNNANRDWRKWHYQAGNVGIFVLKGGYPAITFNLVSVPFETGKPGTTNNFQHPAYTAIGVTKAAKEGKAGRFQLIVKSGSRTENYVNFGNWGAHMNGISTVGNSNAPVFYMGRPNNAIATKTQRAGVPGRSKNMATGEGGWTENTFTIISRYGGYIFHHNYNELSTRKDAGCCHNGPPPADGSGWLDDAMYEATAGVQFVLTTDAKQKYMTILRTKKTEYENKLIEYVKLKWEEVFGKKKNIIEKKLTTAIKYKDKPELTILIKEANELWKESFTSSSAAEHFSLADDEVIKDLIKQAEAIINNLTPVATATPDATTTPVATTTSVNTELPPQTNNHDTGAGGSSSDSRHREATSDKYFEKVNPVNEGLLNAIVQILKLNNNSGDSQHHTHGGNGKCNKGNEEERCAADSGDYSSERHPHHELDHKLKQLLHEQQKITERMGSDSLDYLEKNKKKIRRRRDADDKYILKSAITTCPPPLDMNNYVLKASIMPSDSSSSDRSGSGSHVHDQDDDTTNSGSSSSDRQRQIQQDNRSKYPPSQQMNWSDTYSDSSSNVGDIMDERAQETKDLGITPEFNPTINSASEGKSFSDSNGQYIDKDTTSGHTVDGVTSGSIDPTSDSTVKIIDKDTTSGHTVDGFTSGSIYPKSNTNELFSNPTDTWQGLVADSAMDYAEI